MINIVTACLRFQAEHEECVRVLPYTEGGQVVVQFYVFSDESGMPENLKVAAQHCFGEMKVKLKWSDLYNNSANILNVTPVECPFGEPRLNASQVDEINETISKNLHVFSKHRNITGVQASFKVTKSKQTETPCITIYVLGKGYIPVGESEFPCNLGPYPVDVVDGFWFRTHGPWKPNEAQEKNEELRFGASIGVQGEEEASGTLGAIVEDEDGGTLYALSCDHVMKHSEKSEIVHPGLNDHLNYMYVKYQLNEYGKQIKRITERGSLETKFAVDKLTGSEAFSKRFEELKSIKEKYCDSSKCTARELERMEKHEKAFETGLEPPRVVGNYTTGVSRNVKWTDGKEYFVDCAIAELTADEVRHLKESKTARMIGTADYPSVECNPTTTKAIMNAEKLCKSGRTTGFTKHGRLVSASVDPPMFLKPPLFQASGSGALSDVGMHNYFCQTCAKERPTQMEAIEDISPHCKSCQEGRASLYESLWRKNCLCIASGRYPFADQGDSGAVVFEQSDGLRLPGFGLIFAVHENAHKAYAIASPLQVALKALFEDKNLKLVSNYDE